MKSYWLKIVYCWVSYLTVYLIFFPFHHCSYPLSSIFKKSNLKFPINFTCYFPSSKQLIYFFPSSTPLHYFPTFAEIEFSNSHLIIIGRIYFARLAIQLKLQLYRAHKLIWSAHHCPTFFSSFYAICLRFIAAVQLSIWKHSLILQFILENMSNPLQK